MLKKILISLIVIGLIVLLPLRILAKTKKIITVAVIDTGVDFREANLCKFGHKSFVDRNPLTDTNGHGTHVAGLINQYADGDDYCIVSLKYYADSNNGQQNLDAEIRAIRYAINIKVDFINISGGGPERNPTEQTLIALALAKKITVVVAAGNDGVNLDEECNYFPACYDSRIITVGNLQLSRDWNSLKNGVVAPSSNYGNYVKRWEVGTNVNSTLPGGKTGSMSGTSQAAAIATGKLVRQTLAK